MYSGFEVNFVSVSHTHLDILLLLCSGLSCIKVNNTLMKFK